MLAGRAMAKGAAKKNSWILLKLLTLVHGHRPLLRSDGGPNQSG
jgi:hypothetical protein